MLHAGLVPEVSRLLRSGRLSADMPVAKSIGYRQTIDYLTDFSVPPRDIAAFDEFLASFATATRNYAKRQSNWFRKDPSFLFCRINRSAIEAAAAQAEAEADAAAELTLRDRKKNHKFEKVVR